MNRGHIAEAFRKTNSSKYARLALSLIFIILATAIIMTIYEVGLVIVFPKITVWQSMISDVTFTCIMAPLVALYVLLRFEGLYQEISSEIEERKRAEKTLEEAKGQAELYLDLMGHDINNIHQAASGYIEMSRQISGDDRDVYLDKAEAALRRGAQLISNVRKLQKFHEDRRVQDVDICKVLTDVQAEFRGASGKMITLNLNNYTHCLVRADELVHDVFSNIVGNAVKHTGDHANITMTLEKIQEKGIEYYKVGVEDDGPGIQDSFKERLFNRSIRGTTRAKGMGLGLYIVKTLVDSYGGRVWAEDRVPGDHTKGAKFIVMLPAIE